MFAFATHVSVFIAKLIFGTFPGFFGFWRGIFLQFYFYTWGENRAQNPTTIRDNAGGDPALLGNGGESKTLRNLKKIQQREQQIIIKQKHEMKTLMKQLDEKRDEVQSLKGINC